MLIDEPCPPDYFDVADQKFPNTSRKAAVDRAKTRSQWEYICGVFQHRGFSSIKKIDMAIVRRSAMILQPYAYER